MRYLSSLNMQRWLADLGLFYSAAIWGSTFFIVKWTLDYVEPFMLVALRFLLAAIVMMLLLVGQRKIPVSNFRSGFILGIPLCILYVFQTIGLKYTTAANSGFITGLFVAFVPLFQLLFYKPPPRAVGLIAAVVSLSGLWVLSGGLAQINLGDIFTLVAAMAYAAHILIADRKIAGGSDPYLLSFQQFAIVGLISLSLAPIGGQNHTTFDNKALWAIVFLALFPTLSAFLIQLLAQKVVSPVRVSLIFAFEPVFAGIFAWTLGDEAFTGRQAVGGVLIFVGMVISGWDGSYGMKSDKNQ